MSQKTSIEWTGKTWNPIRARLKQDALMQLSGGRTKTVPAGTYGYHCEHVSPGCKNCYAEAMNGRMLPSWGTGLDYTVPNREAVEIYLDPVELQKPLHWKKPTKIFPCSMTDWCADFVTDEMRDQMLAVCAVTPIHTYQLLTKRSERMCEYFTGRSGQYLETAQIRVLKEAGEITSHWDNCDEWDWILDRLLWPLSNVHIGVSVEDRQRYQERVPLLRITPAALRWLSIEPQLDALGDIDLTGISWVVVGGESGRGARPFDITWAQQTIAQCRNAGVPVFVKQLGAMPVSSVPGCSASTGCEWKIKDRKGGEMSEWPEDLRVREFPNE